LNMHEYLNQVNEQMVKFWAAHEGETVREEMLEDILRMVLSTCWDRYEECPTFEELCDATEIHQDTARKVYDDFMGEEIKEEAV
jgi:DNA-binding transcriptional regulator YhcF (GntR family)